MRLIQISAWNDSGGGFLHRLLDGHPELDVWPFELLLGHDGLRPDLFGPEWFRGRFRWPRLEGFGPDRGAALFDAIGDYELKGVLVDPAGAKHRAFPVEVALDSWRDAVARRWPGYEGRDQAGFLTLYIRTFFELWRGMAGPEDRPVLGHCPIAILDAPEMWADFPDAKLLHVIRPPASGFHDMRLRHPALEPARYGAKWSLINGFAATLAGKYPGRVRLVRLLDLLERRDETLRGLCHWLGLGFSHALLAPSWNGQPLDPLHMGPFGGVPHVDLGREIGLPATLTPAERGEIEGATGATLGLIEAVTASVGDSR